MKKFMMILLACLMVLSLCACGEDTPTETSAPTQTTAAPTVDGSEQTTAPSENETTQPEESTMSIDEILDLVLSYKDQPIEDLIAVIGEPEYSDYAPSCLGEGEDGMLYYDGFVVYTYRENGVETVYDVE